MKYKVILNLDQENKPATDTELSVAKGFLHNVGFKVRDSLSVHNRRSSATIIAETDEASLLEFVRKIAKMFNQESFLIVKSTGFSYLQYLNTGVKVFMGCYRPAAETSLESAGRYTIDSQDNICYKVG